MINKDNYNNNNIIYISNYMYNTDPLYNMNEKELFEIYYPYLKKINSEFSKKDIIELKVFNELYAQPVIKLNYSKEILNIQLKEKGIYMATMAQIYPEDRGMNYAIKIGYEVANHIINGVNKQNLRRAFWTN